MADQSNRNSSDGTGANDGGIWNRLLNQMGVQPAATSSADSPTAPNMTGVRLSREPEARWGAARQSTSTPESSHSDLFSIEEDLKRMALAKNFIAAGKIQILNIRPIAEHFGDKWPRVADRAHQIIGQVLGGHLGPRDIWRRHESFIYIVVFAENGADEARGRMALIGEDIRERLVGEEPGLGLLELQSATYTVDGDVVLARYSKDSAINALVKASAKDAEEPHVREPDEPSPVEAGQTHVHTAPLATPQSIDDRLEEVKRAHAMIEARLQRLNVSNDDKVDAAPEFRMLSDLEGELLRLHDRLARRVPLVMAAPRSTASEPDVPVEHDSAFPAPATLLLMEAENGFMQGQGDKRAFHDETNNLKLVFAYRPAWHVGTNYVGTHFTTAYFQEGYIVKSADTALRRRASADINALIDRCLLRRALIDLAAHDSGMKSLVSVPVHFSTLRHMAHRETHQYLMHTIPKWLRDYLIWEVLDTPKGVLRSHIDEITSLLQAFGNSVMWRTSLYGHGTQTYSGTRVRVVGIHLQERQVPEDRLIRQLAMWASEAKRHGFGCYVRGADTKPLVAQAIEAGIDRIAGDAVRPQVEALGGIAEFTFSA